MGTAQGPQPAQAAAEPRTTPAITPTPRPSELAGYLAQLTAGTLPHVWNLAMDGSAIDPKSFDPTPKTTSFP
jgi:hypothetical protein